MDYPFIILAIVIFAPILIIFMTRAATLLALKIDGKKKVKAFAAKYPQYARIHIGNRHFMGYLEIFSVNGEAPTIQKEFLYVPIGNVTICANYNKDVYNGVEEVAQTAHRGPGITHVIFTNIRRDIRYFKYENPEHIPKNSFAIQFDFKPDIEYRMYSIEEKGLIRLHYEIDDKYYEADFERIYGK